MDVDIDLLSTSVAVPVPSASDMEPVSGPSTSYEPPDAVPGNSDDELICTPPPQIVAPSISSLSACSSKNLTPRKLHLKRRLDIMSNLRSKQKKWYIDRVRNLKGLINKQKMTKIKYNQEIKRKTASLSVKEATIIKLRRQLQEAKGKGRKEVQGPNAIMDDLNLKQLQRMHKRLRDSNKVKRKLKSADTVPLENFTKLQLELTAKN